MSFTVVTGAAGFIGSCLVNKLNNKGQTNLVVVDDFSNPAKNKNLEKKVVTARIHRDEFFTWFQQNSHLIDSVYHLGARTDTTEFDHAVFDRLNLNYSKKVWELCSEAGVPMVYASSAATYGLGEHGYRDDHSIVGQLKPLNPYGESKNDFDKWVLEQEKQPPYWAGVKFFNVYGPNEYHKGRMASVVFHAFHQVKETGKVKLFRSHREGFRDGEQLRDFIFVRDVVDVLYCLMRRKQESGLYNLGTGKARTFLSLAEAVFAAIDKPAVIEFIDTPEDIRDKYQYFTEAVMDKLIMKAGYPSPFYSLEEGITEYVQEYLMQQRYF